jgi:hypothetical protein
MLAESFRRMPGERKEVYLGADFSEKVEFQMRKLLGLMFLFIGVTIQASAQQLDFNKAAATFNSPA